MSRLLLVFVLICVLPASVSAGHSGDATLGPYVIQLASVKSAAAAEGEWSRLQKSHPDLLGDMELTVQEADLGARGIFFRIRTGPFPNLTTAKDMCWQLRAENLDCLVVRLK
ncbi:MAG: SPOR domain-containing protein [Kiloniellaceae bacterium]